MGKEKHYGYIQRCCLAASVICFSVFFMWLHVRAEDPSLVRARQILEEIDDLWRMDSSYSVLTMRVKTSHYTRTVQMESWTKGKEKSLVRILSPKKEKGTATLKSGNTIYTYLPKTDRTIRLTSSMMMGSWMGSHFTNDDLVKESRLSDDYDPYLTFEGERDGIRILEFRLEPRPDAPVVWGRIVITVREADKLPLVSLYYDEDGRLVRTLTFTTIVKMGNRMLPSVMRVVPTEEPDEYTELVYEDLNFDVKPDDSFFSLIQLRRK